MTDATPEQLQALPPDELAYLNWQAAWTATARSLQLPPEPDEQAEWLIKHADSVQCVDPSVPWNEMGYQAGRGFGKALDVDTPVPTPDGWTTMGALRAGDVVFDERGRPCRVLQAHEPYQPSALYRVCFSDGSELVADGEHLWVTWTHAERKRYLRKHPGADRFPTEWAADPGKVRTTGEMLRTLTQGGRGDRNHCVPLAGDLDLPDASLPVDPWLLGYWLGNGAKRDATLSCHADDAALVFSRFKAAGYEITPRAIEREGYAKSLTPALRALGLLYNKHVPQAYLRASAAQRRQLLAGLLDSDGHCHAKSGHVEFCSTDEPLARGVLELARSLGQKPVLSTGRAVLNGKDHGLKYRVNWRPTFNPFDLPRKATAYREPGAQALRNQHRMIVAIERVASRTVRCITVGSPNAMYLAGEAMIPTHNTRVGAEWLGPVAWRCTNKFPYGVIAPTQNDVRFTCFEGKSGLLNVIPAECIARYSAQDLFIVLTNGATIRGFSAEKAERLRGPENAAIWADEIAAWGRDAEYTLEMAKYGLRLGENPRFLWTSTPKPTQLVRTLTTPKPGRIIVRGATFDNRDNLADSFIDEIEAGRGTKMYRQEALGELIDPEEAGIVKRSWINLWPADKPLPRFDWIIMSLDTAYTEKTLDTKGDPDPTACDVVGVFHHAGMNHAMLLDSWDEHLGLPDLMRTVKRELNTAYGDDADEALIKPLFGSSKPMTSGRKPDILLIEDKGSGISLRQMLAREGIEAYAYNPGRADKLSRLHAVSPIFAQRRFWAPESKKNPGKPMTWCDNAISQLCAFTGEKSIKHDDHVDAVAQALRLMMDKNMLRLVKDKPRAASDTPPPKPAVNPYAQ